MFGRESPLSGSDSWPDSSDLHCYGWVAKPNLQTLSPTSPLLTRRHSARLVLSFTLWKFYLDGSNDTRVLPVLLQPCLLKRTCQPLISSIDGL